MRRFGVIAIASTCALLLGACSSGDNQKDELQVVTNPVAATAALSPPTTGTPTGSILPVSQEITSMVTDPSARVLAVAVAAPPSVQLYRLDSPQEQPRSIPMAGRVERLTISGGQVLASVPEQKKLVRLDLTTGTTTETTIDGQPTAAQVVGNSTVVTVRDRKAVEILEGDVVRKTISGELSSVDDLITTQSATVVLDRLRSALFAVDLEGGKITEGLRAGDGAANAVADSYGRVLVTDARAGALLAFSTDPLLLRQRYPVSGGIYGIAYDDKRVMAWVTLTERNEVVGYDIRGGEPTEKYHFPTVRQPNTVTIDPQTATVIIGSATGGGIQVIKP